MKKWIAALCIAILAWNIYLTVQLSELNRKPAEVGSDVVDTKVTNYTTNLTDTVSAWRSSVVTVTSGSAYGSGVIFSTDENTAFVFTATDALSQENPVSVIFDSGTRRDAAIVGSDSETGLSLLSVPVEFEVRPFTHGDSSLLKQGEYVIAMGGRRPSTGTGTVSFGVVSEPGQRKIALANTWTANVIETDATVSADNLGGALMNMGGELNGMLISRPAGGQDRMGYAVSVNEMKLVYGELMENGSVSRGSLAATGRSLSDLLAYERNALGIPLDQLDGVLITSVSYETDSSLEAGDILTQIDENPISDTEELRRLLYQYEAGSTVEITFLHEGQEVTESVELR